jgi:hypothetical protein
MLAFAMMATIRHHANARPSDPQKPCVAPAIERQILPAQIIAWSLWRQAHQAAAQQAHIKSKAQL